MARKNTNAEYNDDSVRSLDWREHIRLRPGMYIGKLGDGTAKDDGIYVLLKEVIDNCIDEFVMGHGKEIDVILNDHTLTIRDRGRGIPLGKVIECVSQINTGAKYDSGAFQKSVGLNGVGTKAVNALSAYFKVQSVRDGKTTIAEFVRGDLTKSQKEIKTDLSNGTTVTFIPDNDVFIDFNFNTEHIERMLNNYAYLNVGLKINFNVVVFQSQNGLSDLLESNMSEEKIYPLVHLRDKDIELAFTHTNAYGEEYYSFVNGQHTTQGGTHQAALREALVKTAREFYKKEFDPNDVRSGIMAALSVRIQEPVFESQTKTKLGSQNTEPNGPSLRNWIVDFVKNSLDNYLHKHPEVAEAWRKKIESSERERKEIAGVRKLANERAKKANLHNKKLRDCRVHLDTKHPDRFETTVFITEGDSASGSITSARDVNTQAVFSLRGKPLNCFGLTKKIVYENEEFNLLQAALNIEDGLEGLRYNKVVISTDADVDGMHIRLLILTFFLQFFPDLVKNGHVYILDTPLFRVRNKKETIYCYTPDEKIKAIEKLGPKPEITRFKGLGEISPDEFKKFIGKKIKLDPVEFGKDTVTHQLLDYYMGKNTPDRQQFIIENLKMEEEPEEALAFLEVGE
ncbi:MAG: type IIA DNA topoisomerase subunit B [Bacteroidetes bacterium]|nr:type IIA DNA topoisomerase subunit B [Bacteroidota bacterium]